MTPPPVNRRKMVVLFLAVCLLLFPGIPGAEKMDKSTHPLDLATAWKALRAGDISKAREAFTAALKERPDRVEALNGLGYVALREGDLGEASRRFGAALEGSPNDRDALVGKALVKKHLGKLEEARDLLDRVLTSYPGDREARDLRVSIARALEAVPESAPASERHLPPENRPRKIALPMRVKGRVFELRGTDGSYHPFFLKAVNLGAALPGKFPSEFPADRALYLDWFTKMRECGFTAVRLYTIFPPVFYETLETFNRDRKDPLYLIHGVWLEPPEGDDFSNPAFVASFRAEIRRVVDLLHGGLELPKRPGHASGSYRTDVSRWWIATILGREWEPFNVTNYNSQNPGSWDYTGRFLKGRNLHAMERWLADQTEYAVAYETDRWNAQRPIAWTNWPTLDPLFHPTETTKAEENIWRRRLKLPQEPGGVREYDNDDVGIDLEKFESTERNRGGLFASYHAYPYYPDFMIYDPGYLAAHDGEGPNAYYGYLRDLVLHHRKHPVFIAEFGVPTSREVAHSQPQGWTHGGHSEEEKGKIDGRLFRTIYSAGTTGGCLFAWIDEWFKHNWLVIEYHRPMERNRLWHDRQDAEQNYGLIGYRGGAPGPSVVIDGKDNEWREKDVLLSSTEKSSGIIRSLSVRSDETDLYLLLLVEQDTEAGFAIMFDVVDPALGDFRFSAGLDLSSNVGFEASLLFDGERARIVIDQYHERYRNRYERPISSQQNKDGFYVSPLIKPNRMRITRGGKVIPETILDIGWLREGTTDREDPAFDDRAEWKFDRKKGIAEFRIPWGILNVTDPSSRSVLFEGKDYPEQIRQTEGFRLAAAAFHPDGGKKIRARRGKALEVLPPPGPGGIVTGLPLYTWGKWEEPSYHSFEKRSFGIVRDALEAIPHAPVK